MRKLKKSIYAKRGEKQKEKPDGLLPLYEAGGYAPAKNKQKLMKPLCFLGVVVLFLLAIYLPEILYSNPEPDNAFILTADFSAVKKTNEYTRDCPEEDFDGDGLVNYLEQQYGTSPRRSDTDGDGVSDYAEIYLTDTSPSVFDEGLMEKQVDQILKQKGSSYSEPYKMAGTILWADDLEARAFGGAVRTWNGYRFCSFRGWAEFPEAGYAYAVSDDVYTLLEYREDSNAWRINGDCQVYFSKTPLEYKHCLRLASWEWELPDNAFGRAMSAIFPDHAGILRCSPKAVHSDSVTEVKADRIQMPEYDPEEKRRFGSNHNGLEALSEIYAQIDAGSCIAASLNSADAGETVILVYGYTSDGHLLIADPETTKPAGKLFVYPAVDAILMEDGEIEYENYFEFYGLGFDSQDADRIHFITASAEG